MGLLKEFIPRTIIIQEREIPALQTTEVQQVWGTRADGRPVLQSVAQCISLRTTNPLDREGNPQTVRTYLTETPENIRFTPLRFGAAVVGLDVDEHGGTLGYEVLSARMKDDIKAQQAARAATQAANVVSLSDAMDAEDETDEGDSDKTPA